ncbi:MAG: hypothetical protein JXA20_16560 [Spirochaetes bacterium]|nr:hypothetical protein [Spirochaetota bacterium]
MKKTFLLLILIAAVSLFAQDPFPRSGAIDISLFSVSLSKDGPPHQTREYRPGQTVWINLKVRGLKMDNAGDIVFQSDLKLVRENGEVALDKQNILNLKLHAAGIQNPVVTANYHVDLFETIRDGRYKVDIVVRDIVAMRSNSYMASFRVVRD